MNPRQAAMLGIALVYSILAILYATLIPPFESPDEPAHYLYAAQLAERARPPIDPMVPQRDNFYNDRPFISSNYEWYQPTLGYLLPAMTYKILDTLAPDNLPRVIPPFNPGFGQNPFANPALFRHEPNSLLGIWQGNWGLLVIRIVSSLLGIGMIYATYRAGTLLDKPNGLLGIAAAGWLAFLPQLTFINANVRSDTLTNVIAALVFLAAARMQSAAVNQNKSALFLGILLGLGLLCKYTFIYIVPIGFLAVIFACPRDPRNWIQPLLFLVLPMLVLVGAYYLVFPEAHAALEYALTATQIKPELLTWRYFKTIPEPLLLGLFYARFGWANVVVSDIWQKIAFSLWILGTGITVVQTLRVIKKREYRDSIKIITLLSLGILFALAGVIRFNLSVYQPQGRLLFPALLPWSVLGFWGVWQILPERGAKIATILVVGFMLLFNIYALFFTLAPAYWQ